MQCANTGKNTGMSAQRIARFLIPAAKEEKHLIKARGICAREHTATASSGGPWFSSSLPSLLGFSPAGGIVAELGKSDSTRCPMTETATGWTRCKAYLSMLLALRAQLGRTSAKLGYRICQTKWRDGGQTGTGRSSTTMPRCWTTTTTSRKGGTNSASSAVQAVAVPFPCTSSHLGITPDVRYRLLKPALT